MLLFRSPLPKGICHFTVTFEINSDGILNVFAEDMESHSKNYLTVQSSKLTEEEIKEMIKEASKFKKEDEIRKDIITAKDDLEHCILQIMDVLEENEIDETERIVIENNCRATKKWMEDDEFLQVQDYNKKKDELKKICSILINIDLK